MHNVNTPPTFKYPVIYINGQLQQTNKEIKENSVKNIIF